MVKNRLTDQMVKDGKQFVEKLLKSDLEISAAVWFYMEESEKWRLIIASPEVKTKGPNFVYSKLQSYLKEMGKDNLSFDVGDISAYKPDHKIVRLLSKVFGSTEGITEIRFSKNFVDTRYIEDSLVYYLDE
jgi:hypothetical protein